MKKDKRSKNPKSDPKNRVVQTFSIAAPNARNVQLAGDFTDWQQQAVPMIKGTDGVWRAAVRLAPGIHAYRFLVDGRWEDDLGCLWHEPNPFGSRNAIRKVA